MCIMGEARGVDLLLCAVSVEDAHRVNAADLSTLGVVLSVAYKDTFLALCGIVYVDADAG